jgi:hypothetical protein
MEMEETSFTTKCCICFQVQNSKQFAQDAFLNKCHKRKMCLSLHRKEDRENELSDLSSIAELDQLKQLNRMNIQNRIGCFWASNQKFLDDPAPYTNFAKLILSG